jgi:hypothetical protein
VILELVAGAAAAAADPEASTWLELAKTLGGGAAGTFALLAWQALRTERTYRKNDARQRGDRQRELDARLEHMGELLARIDERTRSAYLVGEESEPAVPRKRTRTPVQGVRPLPRKPTEGG